MSTKTETTHTGEFLLSEAEGNLSRDNVLVTVPGDTTLAAGTVLAVSGLYHVPMTAGLVDASAVLGILYGELVNASADPAHIEGAVINCFAEVRGADLDWNSANREAQQDAIDLLRTQGVKIRDYTPPADGS